MDEVCEQLDSLVLKIFQVLEDVYHKQDRLEQVMKDGFLGISRTRYSLGVKRVCSDQFVDAELRASRTVLVEEDALKGSGENSDQEVFHLQKRDYKKQTSKETKKSTSGADLSDEKTTGASGLRQRNVSKTTKKQETDDGYSEQDLKTMEKWERDLIDSIMREEDSEEETKLVANPLTLFGVLVPEHLRNSQKSFEEAVELSVSLGNLKSKLRHLQEEYRTLRLQKEKLKSEEDSLKSSPGDVPQQPVENEA